LEGGGSLRAARPHRAAQTMAMNPYVTSRRQGALQPFAEHRRCDLGEKSQLARVGCFASGGSQGQ